MVTTRSQSLSSRFQTTQKSTVKVSDNVSRKPVTRSQTITVRTSTRTAAKSSAPSPYATRSKRMNTRSNTKRFIELSDREHTPRMTRSMTKFIEKYSDYTGMKTRSMTKCM